MCSLLRVVRTLRQDIARIREYFRRFYSVSAPLSDLMRRRKPSHHRGFLRGLRKYKHKPEQGKENFVGEGLPALMETRLEANRAQRSNSCFIPSSKPLGEPRKITKPPVVIVEPTEVS